MFKINRLAFMLGVKAARTVAAKNHAVIVRDGAAMRLTVEKPQTKLENVGLQVSTRISQGAAFADAPDGAPIRWQIDLDVCERIIEAAGGIDGDMVVDNMNDRGRMTMRVGSVSFAVALACSGKLPEVEPADVYCGAPITYTPEEVAEMYEVVHSTTRRSDARPRLRGVAISTVEGVLSAYSTDGTMASVSQIYDATNVDTTAWIHQSVVKYLSKTYPSGASVHLSGFDGQLTRTRLDCGPTTWTWEYHVPVDLAEVLKVGGDPAVVDVTDEMVAALALAESTTGASAMHVEFAPDGNDPGAVVIRSLVGAPPFFATFKSEQTPMRIAFCARKMSRVIRGRAGLTMELRGALSQIIIRQRGELVGVVMPVRL